MMGRCRWVMVGWQMGRYRWVMVGWQMDGYWWVMVGWLMGRCRWVQVCDGGWVDGSMQVGEWWVRKGVGAGW